MLASAKIQYTPVMLSVVPVRAALQWGLKATLSGHRIISLVDFVDEIELLRASKMIGSWKKAGS